MSTSVSPAEGVRPVLPDPLPPHPRLCVQPDSWEQVRRRIEKGDPVSTRTYKSVKIKADQFLEQLPVTRVMVGRRMLSTSRQVLERISTLAMVYNIEGEQRYADRAIAEMLAVADFTDWNPSHFLDVAEMSLALALGYDWLYAKLDADQREMIETALIELGLKPSFAGKQFFIDTHNNWNQVCHAGMAAAAIVVADREPELAETTLRRAVENVPRAAAVYGPDGAYPEGPMYWGYGTSFHVVLVHALKQLTGSGHGLDTAPGFAESAEYMRQVTTPRGEFYPYFDCRTNRTLEFPLFWFAAHYNRPDWAAYDLRRLDEYLSGYDGQEASEHYRLLPLTLLWVLEGLSGEAPKAAQPALSWMARGLEPIAIFRTAFDYPNAPFAAIKGGSPGHNHGHMDAGSFIIETQGVRWALDLGMQDYESLESINVNMWQSAEGGQRWNVFRLGPASHNILTFNGKPQRVSGMARITHFSGAEQGPRHVVINLAGLYPGQVSEASRGLAMLGDDGFLFQDEWVAGAEPLEVAWQWLTEAKVDVDEAANTVTLAQAGRKLRLKVLEPAEIRVQVTPAHDLQQPYDAPNPDVSRIDIMLKTAAGQPGRLRVLALPGDSGKAAVPACTPLSAWVGLVEQ